MLYIDISHILNWNGRLTGIERVEYHIIKYYYQQNSAGFVYWDRQSSGFLIADRKFVEDKVINRPDTAKAEVSRTQKIKMFARFKTDPEQVRFSKNDTLLVLAGLWDVQAYIDAVCSIQAKIVHIVYDMIPLVCPQYIVDYLPPVFDNYMTSVIPRCSEIFAISKSTANDLKLIFKQKKTAICDVKVFRLGDDIDVTSKPVKPANVPDKFCLCVGTVEARKNHTLLYYVYKKAADKGVNLPTLIIVGRKGWNTDDLYYLIGKDPEVKDKIIMLDEIKDSELIWLYKNCLFTVFPSFYEGWGLPIAESLFNKKVTLASNTSSMPEVGGDGADYFSPYSADELIALMGKYGQSKFRLKREGEILYPAVSWDEAVRSLASEVDRDV